MSFFVSSQVVRRRVWFSASVTGTPTAQVYVNNVAVGDAIDGTGAGEAWSFVLTMPSDLETGASVQIEAVATVAGSIERRQLDQGSVVVLHTQSGTGAGERMLTVEVVLDSDDTIGVPGARVSLVGTLASRTTLEDGIVQFRATPNTYTLRIVAPIGFIDPEDREVTIPAMDDVVETVSLVQTIPTSPVTSGQCAAIAFVVDAALQPVVGAKVFATLVSSRPTFSGTAAVTDTEATLAPVLTNSAGRAELVRGRLLTYDFEVQVGDNKRIKVRRTLPDASSSIFTLKV